MDRIDDEFWLMSGERGLDNDAIGMGQSRTGGRACEHACQPVGSPLGMVEGTRVVWRGLMRRRVTMHHGRTTSIFGVVHVEMLTGQQ